ncbi:AAA family ATPase [Roseovarius rhodophyticola]|uniref:AAA family ATPase n=1 Tax=Roseovarius rhodophyticola TaxID=3080827 RepID=UPI003BB0624F
MTELCLTHLTLSHFRSHKTARIEGDGRPIALFGPNGAGKTNILEAVSLFLRGAGCADLRRKTWRADQTLSDGN